MVRTIAFIFARGGSKGVPGKNVKLLAGKPLIGYAVETALACKEFESVIVSTDCEEIANVARGFGASTPFMRPQELGSDTASEWDAWRHAIRFVLEHSGPFDRFVSLPATSPFRNVSDVKACLSALDTDPHADMIITGCPANRNPYFNMVRRDERGYVELVMSQGKNFSRRQDVPDVYDVTTVAYVSTPSFILGANNIWEGNVRLVEIPPERAIDIDTPHDFFVSECIAKMYPNIHLT